MEQDGALHVPSAASAVNGTSIAMLSLTPRRAIASARFGLTTRSEGRDVPERDYALRLRAQTLMAEGSLPSAMPVRTVAGFGSGRPCALCDEMILSTEPEVELYFQPRALDSYYFHRPCYDLWLAERLRATNH